MIKAKQLEWVSRNHRCKNYGIYVLFTSECYNLKFKIIKLSLGHKNVTLQCASYMSIDHHSLWNKNKTFTNIERLYVHAQKLADKHINEHYNKLIKYGEVTDINFEEINYV